MEKKYFTTKNNIEKLKKIKGVSYYWAIEDYPEKNFTDKKQIGVLAQDVQAVFPELVLKDKQGFLSVNYSALIAPLIEAFKEQQKQIEENVYRFKAMQGNSAEIKIVVEESKREIASLKTENEQIRTKVVKLEIENAQIKSRTNKLEVEYSQTKARLDRIEKILKKFN